MQFKVGQYDVRLSYEIEQEEDSVDNTCTKVISSYAFEVTYKGKPATNVSKEEARIIAQEVEEKLEEVLDGYEA